MKKNFVKILACTLAMSTMCSVTTASAYTNLTNDMIENMSDELKDFILNSGCVKQITDNCVIKSIYYTGLDENGKETYDYAQREENGLYMEPAIGVLLGFDENGYEIIAGANDFLIWFDEENNPMIIKTSRIGVTEDGDKIFKTNDVVTGEEIVVISNGSFGGNADVIARCGDSSLDGTVDVRDVTTINQHIIKENILPDYTETVADVNNDGNIDISDLGMLKKYVIKMIDSF